MRLLRCPSTGVKIAAVCPVAMLLVKVVLLMVLSRGVVAAQAPWLAAAAHSLLVAECG